MYTAAQVLGLAIARKVIENHDGKIVAEGKPDEGSIFRIFLPGRMNKDNLV